MESISSFIGSDAISASIEALGKGLFGANKDQISFPVLIFRWEWLQSSWIHNNYRYIYRIAEEIFSVYGQLVGIFPVIPQGANTSRIIKNLRNMIKNESWPAVILESTDLAVEFAENSIKDPLSEVSLRNSENLLKRLRNGFMRGKNSQNLAKVNEICGILENRIIEIKIPGIIMLNTISPSPISKISLVSLLWAEFISQIHPSLRFKIIEKISDENAEINSIIFPSSFRNNGTMLYCLNCFTPFYPTGISQFSPIIPLDSTGKEYFIMIGDNPIDLDRIYLKILDIECEHNPILTNIINARISSTENSSTLQNMQATLNGFNFTVGNFSDEIQKYYDTPPIIPSFVYHLKLIDPEIRKTVREFLDLIEIYESGDLIRSEKIHFMFGSQTDTIPKSPHDKYIILGKEAIDSTIDADFRSISIDEYKKPINFGGIIINPYKTYSGNELDHQVEEKSSKNRQKIYKLRQELSEAEEKIKTLLPSDAEYYFNLRKALKAELKILKIQEKIQQIREKFHVKNQIKIEKNQTRKPKLNRNILNIDQENISVYHLFTKFLTLFPKVEMPHLQSIKKELSRCYLLKKLNTKKQKKITKLINEELIEKWEESSSLLVKKINQTIKNLKTTLDSRISTIKSETKKNIAWTRSKYGQLFEEYRDLLSNSSLKSQPNSVNIVDKVPETGNIGPKKEDE